MTTTTLTTTHLYHGSYPVTAVWHGGAYIEVTLPGRSTPDEVINVWDYEADQTTIPFTQEALDAELADWLEAAEEYNVLYFYRMPAVRAHYHKVG